MDMTLSFQQQQQLSQMQIQSLEILSMDNIELNQFLKNEYLENPLLEHSEKSNDNTSAEPLTSYYEWNPGGSGIRAVSDEEDTRRRDFSAPKEDVLKDYLLSQLNMKLYSKKEWQLFSYLIGCLDDNGFFTMPVYEVMEKTGAPAEAVQKALDTLKELEPYGIFSSNLKECLLCQLDAMDMNTESLTLMVQEYLEDIASGRISNISRNLHLPTASVRKNIEIIAHLNPRPLSGFGAENNNYIIPDIIFRKDNGDWSASLNDSWTGNYYLNDYYMKMMQNSSDEELIAYFKTKLARVNFILRSIEQRRKTILSVSRIILDKQKNFLEGTSPLTPMTMSDIADIAGIHTSTVSRALKGKYVQYPKGNILIKNLFTAPVSSMEQGNITPMHVKQCIRELIAAEDKKTPYSDQTLVKLLAEQDIHVSRRAIAKYREELGIKSSFDRRSF